MQSCRFYFLVLLILSVIQILFPLICFSLFQVNGVNIGGLRHSEVVELIKSRGNEVRLLVVDQETDELFHRLQITPTGKHITGHTF